MTTHPPIRIGVIGLGAVAQSVHLPLLRRHPELFDLVAVSEISPTVLKSVGTACALGPGARYLNAFDILDHEGLEAILIASGGTHEPLVVAAIERGLAVLCEKPLAVTLHEIASIETALAPFGDAPRLMVGYMKQYDPAVTRMVELMAGIDDIRSIDVTVLHPTGQSQLDFANLVTSPGDIPDEVIRSTAEHDASLRRIAFGEANPDGLWPIYAGCLMASLSHDFSVLRRTSSRMTTVDFADIWTTRSANQVRETGRDRGLGDPPPSIRAIGRTGDNTRVVLDWHYLHDFPAYRETVRIIHGAGSLELVFPSPYLLHRPTVLTVRRPNGDAEEVVEFRSTAEAFEVQLIAFAGMVRRGEAPLSGVAAARQDIQTGQAIMRKYAEINGIELGGELGSTVLDG